MMYAVIFSAEINELDTAYHDMAARMRERALEQYDCLDLVSVMEGSREVTISYWNSEEQIRAWKQDTEHLVAQQLGRSKWYKSYQVQVVEVVRDYSSGGTLVGISADIT
jgi:heme-degrading monooxygenase HmoA